MTSVIELIKYIASRLNLTQSVASVLLLFQYVYSVIPDYTPSTVTNGLLSENSIYLMTESGEIIILEA